MSYGTGAGTAWANWSGVANLQHGGQYGICAQGRYSFTNDSLFFPDGPNSCSMGTMLGRRAYTTIDRSKPSAAITLAGGAAYTRDAKVAAEGGLQRRRRGPVPGQLRLLPVRRRPDRPVRQRQGLHLRLQRALLGPRGRRQVDELHLHGGLRLGREPGAGRPVWACVRAADAAIPDNPSSSNQSASADKANLSDPACDGVVLDRTAPAASIAASATAVKVGELVTFQAQATDATSGVGAQSAWTWGDNTAGGSGASATHTFTQAGTYEVKLTVADNAGNPARPRR